MTVQDQIEAYIAAQPGAKRAELAALDRRIRALAPGCRLWFLDGRNEQGKVVTNPNIGYGAITLGYADGGTREFYRIGLSANTGGVSVYVMGLDDKTWLATTYGARLGKAKVTGYCIRFRALNDIDLDVLDEIVTARMGAA